ncbi:tetratricopeptide repeat protein [Bacteroidota bacterium]
MKKIKNSALIILAAAVMSSCGGLNKMRDDTQGVTYKVDPPVLEMHGGKVDVGVTATYPPEYFNKKAILTVAPVVKYDGGEKALTNLVVQGEDVTENYTEIGFETGGKESISDSFEYTDDMILSELWINISAVAGNKSVDIGDIKIADGIKVTSNLLEINPNVLTFSDNYKRIIPDEYVTDIKYVINRADVRKSEINKEEVVGLTDFLKEANENERVELKKLEISAYASPDGELDFNEKLSVKRQNSANKYLSSTLKKEDVAIAEELLSLLSTAEDWEGFQKLLKESSIQDKEMILRVLSMHSDPEVREQEIRNISAAFEVIKEEILPELRRSKFTVSIDRVGWSDEELVNLWNSDPNKLNLEELLYTATLVDDMQTKADIYKRAIAVESRCLRAFNNYGWALFNLGKYDEAEAAFNNAKEIKDHDIINNNLGAVALLKNDVVTAAELFTSALGAGDEVNYNLGIANMIVGDYDKAKNYFGSELSFNLSLLNYLTGNDELAFRTVVDLPEESAKQYYLAAAIAAFQGKNDVALTNLKISVSKDASLKARAKKDIEFKALFENDEFKSIVQ